MPKKRKKVYLIDNPNFRTTRHWRDYLMKNHDFVHDMYFNPIYAAWADVIWCEWAEGSARQMALGEGHFEGVYDHAGLAGEKNKQHTGDWNWKKAKMFIRGIDIDLHFGHFRGIDWSNIEAFCYIAPHFKDDLIMKNMVYPDKLKIVETPLSVKIDEWTYRDRPCGEGRDIAWISHNWAAKNLQLGYFALAKLIEKTGDKSWKLHVVSSGKSNEHWMFSYLDHLLDTLDIRDNVIEYGRVESIDEFLEDKHFLWGTSAKEGFSLISGEAMAKGLHVYMMNWKSSTYIWGEEPVCNTIDELADKTIADKYDSTFFKDLVATRSHHKEVDLLRDITGL